MPDTVLYLTPRVKHATHKDNDRASRRDEWMVGRFVREEGRFTIVIGIDGREHACYTEQVKGLC